MKIHFICKGNTFRSRLVEAYLNSKKTKLKASSSGIKAELNYDGPICWYTQRILTKNKLISLTKPSWTKTTRELLDSADLVIFIDEACYEYCQKKLAFRGKNYEIWEIPDVYDLKDSEEQTLEKDIELIKATEKIFDQIKKKADQLRVKL